MFVEQGHDSKFYRGLISGVDYTGHRLKSNIHLFVLQSARIQGVQYCSNTFAEKRPFT